MRRKRDKVFDFKPMGKAIRLLREEQGLTREQVAERLNIDARYYGKIEGSGQYPSFGVLYDLIKMFNFSVDEHFMPDTKISKSTSRRNIEKLLDELSEGELEIVKGTIKGIINHREN
jgi:transcriptional regulator with XRE-family HTH domain